MNKLLFLALFFLDIVPIVAFELTMNNQYFFDGNIVQDFDVISPKISENEFYYAYTGKIENDSCYFYFNTCKEKSVKQISIKIPIYSKFPYFSDYHYDGKRAIIATGKKTYFYKIIDSNNYHLEYINNSSHIFEKIYLKDSKIYTMCFSPQTINNHRDLLIKQIDINTFEQDSFYLPSPIGIEFLSLQPRKILDISDKHIALSSTKEYSIDIYSMQSRKLLYRINKQYTNWKNAISDISEKLWRNSPYKFFDFVGEKWLTESLIQKVYLVDTNKLLVIWNNIDSDSTYMQNYDLYSIDDEKWSDISSASFKVNAKLDEAFNPITYTHNDVQYANGKLYTITNFPFDYKDFIGKTVREMRKAMEEYYLDNEIILSAFIWDFK